MKQGIWIAKRIVVLGAVVMLLGGPAFARDFGRPDSGSSNEMPKEYEGIGVDERLGEKIDLDLTFKDENGNDVPLRSFVSAGKPILLTLAYYACPNLCSLHINGLNAAFKSMKEPLGREFNFVTVSIDPREKPDLARAKKENYLRAYGRPEGGAGWHFLVGEESAIRSLANAVGFKYRWDEGEKQYAHASAAVVITPDGRISRYFHGIEFEPKTLRLSLVEASSGKIGSFVDRVVLFCFHYDPKASRYTLYATNIMKGGGAMMAVVLAGFIVPFWIRSKKEEQLASEEL